MKRLLILAVLLFSVSAYGQDTTQTARKVVVGVSNAGSTGTTVNRLAKLTGAPSTVVVSGTSDTDGAIGVVVSGAGTSGVATIQTNGQVGSSTSGGCAFDGATTAGDYVQISSSAAGKCHDTGASTYPTSGQIIGRVLSTNGSAGTYSILLTPGVKASSGGVSGLTTNTIPKATSATAIGDSSLTDDGTNINTTESVGIGSTVAPPTKFTVFDTSTSSPRGIMSWQSNTGTDGARLHLRKSRGTFASPTVVVTGDTLGRVVATGYDGSNFLEMGSLSINATGTIAATRVPTQMVFSTATDAAPSVLTAALTLGANQSATFAGVILAADGSVSAPGISFTNNTNSGMYQSGGNSVRFAAAGSQYFLIAGDQIQFVKQLVFTSDNAVDIGATNATRPRRLYLGTGLSVEATITAAGTTGAQTINKTAGAVNFAASASSLVVTNSTVTANSIVICTVQTNDSTLKSVQCVPTSNSFTIFANAAATAETRVGFLVVEPD